MQSCPLPWLATHLLAIGKERAALCLPVCPSYCGLRLACDRGEAKGGQMLGGVVGTRSRVVVYHANLRRVEILLLTDHVGGKR